MRDNSGGMYAGHRHLAGHIVLALPVLFFGACGRTELLPARSPPLTCNGRDVRTDNQNCGACGNVCAAGAPSTAHCALGRCLVTLAEGTVADVAVGVSDVHWTSWSGSSPMKVPKSGGPPVMSTPVESDVSGGGIAIDATYLYWTTYVPQGAVIRAPLDGGSPTSLATNQPYPQTVAVHTSGVYWGTWDSTHGSVMRLAPGEGAPTILAKEQQRPGPIQFGATDLYWTNRDKMVMRMPMAGGQATALVAAPKIHPRIAVSGGSVYYCQYEDDADIGAVMKVPSGGGAPTVLASGHPAGLAVDGDSVYWAEVDPSGGSNDAIMRMPVGGGTPTMLASGLHGPDGIVVDETSVYFVAYDARGARNSLLMRITPK